MHYVIPTFVEDTTTWDNCSVAAHYRCDCPYCFYNNIVWLTEFDKREYGFGNKCDHYFGISKNGKFVFKATPTIRIIDNGNIYIDGYNTHFKNIVNLINSLNMILLDEDVYNPLLRGIKAVIYNQWYGNKIRDAKVKLVINTLNKMRKKIYGQT